MFVTKNGAKILYKCNLGYYLTFLNRKKPNKGAFRKKLWSLGNLLLKIIFVAAFGYLLWLGWIYTKPSNAPINQVKIVASYQHIDQSALQDIVSSYLSNGFYYLNVLGLKNQLLKLPWVYAVSIERQWPDKVVISVVEQQAVLQWGNDALVNPEGLVFSPPTDSFPENLPIIFGPEDQEPAIFSLYNQMQDLFQPLEMTVKQLFFNQQHFWEVTLSSGILLSLKEQNPVDQVNLFIRLYPKLIAGHKSPPKAVDLRYETGMAVKWD